MRTLKLTRAQRRRLRKLADPLRRITQGDLAYFERFPHRRYRVREADCGGGMTPRPGNRHYRAVRYLTPYTCLQQTGRRPGGHRSGVA